jgi:hypothetical protein
MTILFLNGKKDGRNAGAMSGRPLGGTRQGGFLRPWRRIMGARWDDTLSSVNFPMEFSRYRRKKLVLPGS